MIILRYFSAVYWITLYCRGVYCVRVMDDGNVEISVVPFHVQESRAADSSGDRTFTCNMQLSSPSCVCR